MNRHPLLALALALSTLSVVGCDGGPPLPDPRFREAHYVSPPRRLEMLFVIDDGPTMCEEQAGLTRGFQAFSRFAFAELLPQVQLTVAVVRADLAGSAVPGQLLVDPAPPVADARCASAGVPDIPDTADCAGLIEAGELPPVVGVGPGQPTPATCAEAADPAEAGQCARDHFDRQFRCLATLGTGREAPPQGLEAMRLALDCNGPNRALFEACCVDTGDPERGSIYNPGCRAAGDDAPRFLHPDAFLMVLFVSDRDDCSGGGADCADPTPVRDYYRFLTSLKARPLAQLWVTALVGPPAFTAEGWPISWVDEPPLEGCAPGSTDDACCPGGVCRGPEAPSCVSARGEAYAGLRYRRLAREFDAESACEAPDRLPPDTARAVACDGEAQGAACQWRDALDDPRDGICLPPGDGTGAVCTDCATICHDDLGGAIAGPWADWSASGPWRGCLQTTPACRVVEDGGRACATDAERAAPENRPLEVRLVCPPPSARYCAGLDAPLGADDWTLHLDAPDCDGKPMIELQALPPPGSQVEMRYHTEG